MEIWCTNRVVMAFGKNFMKIETLFEILHDIGVPENSLW